ncbi:hypothetical protein K504DRAFT_489918 [Pleomassaria siparia CBS 279.74]|uniref:P-loop containing nucleoside triphosphate hydrolase protein n=1 Tax=Pleomassaria siparia CBS 279.74 TaxID=1314801 RepID=A0A6G1KDJ4_9PLEO|nr:hypothetical protein K504DRAFT_489918 [Pleomassaria siparia CBS 279.74]
MAWDAFHAKAKAALPAQKIPDKRYWIGVLIHNKAPEQHLQETDFVWMMAHAKISLKRVSEAYAAKHPGIDVRITFQDETLEPSIIVKNLNHHKDNIIIFRAERQDQTPLRPVSLEMGNGIQRAPSNPPIKPLAGSSAFPPSLLVPVKPKNGTPGRKYGAPLPPSTPVSVINGTHQHPPSQLPHQTDPSDHTKRMIMPTLAQPAFGHRQYPPYCHWKAYQPPPVPFATPVTPLPMQPQSVKRVSNTPSDVMPRQVVKPEKISPPLRENPVRPPLELFNPDDVFKKDPSPGREDEADVRPGDVFLRQLAEKEDAELLEAGVKRAFKVLDSLKESFSQYAASSPDANTWVESIDKLKTQAGRKPTVVGVVGNTGAGKSSVINALLDEERLVPTNCMRACTAVVTEMSWNDSPDPMRKYRATIEFITAVDWQREVTTLLKEFLGEGGNGTKDSTDPNSDAGIAWAKFHAVYPRMTKEMLSNSTVDILMNVKAVLNVLGTTKFINSSRPEPFYRELQRYVDSKEKATGKKTKKDKGQAGPEMEYWPLIKVVKIQTKSSALSTGAVIVDLPGVHDSNAARSAVAQGYMKQCSGLWIVAPINRAVDDKAAKTLLGDSFKRQLKYDGGFSSVTFICSKTDDISITEATDSLDLEEIISALDKEHDAFKKRREELLEEITTLKESVGIYQMTVNEVSDQIDRWDALKDALDEGLTVYAPLEKIRKRKRGSTHKKSRNRSDFDDEDYGEDIDEESISVSSSSSDDDSYSEVVAPRQPLTEEDIKTRLEELKATKKHARREKGELDVRTKEVRKELLATKSKMAGVRAEMSAICIAGRNDYSKTAIQNDFAAGIRELDMENAQEEDEENFNPDEDIRDYEKVARSLPVFCVSSRAYQKMCGRLEKDDQVPGFETPEQTEMPQLQAHCKKLTEAGRIQTCKTFLSSLCRLLNTFSLWSSNDGSGLKMTNDEKHKQIIYLRKRLDELEKGLEKAVEICVNTMKREMCEQIFDKYPELIREATDAAPAVTRSWGAHKSEGGLVYPTYKAVVRRDGVYQSATFGLQDFNAQLIDPITKRLATGWERTFQNRLPKTFQVYTQDSSKVLHHFHKSIEERAQQNGVGLASLSLLQNQIVTYEQQFGALNTSLASQMNELQRDANREFTPTIVAIMHEVYERCADERGQGSYMRMKAYMNEHVDRKQHHMFTAATQTVHSRLNQMCRALEDKMSEESDQVFTGMQRDYMQALGGVVSNKAEQLPKEERSIRSNIRSLLLTVDEQFRSIASGQMEEEAVDEVIKENVSDEVENAIVDDVDEGSIQYDHPATTMSPTKHDSGTGNTFPAKSFDSDGGMRYPKEPESTISNSYNDNEEEENEVTEDDDEEVEQGVQNGNGGGEDEDEDEDDNTPHDDDDDNMDEEL